MTCPHGEPERDSANADEVLAAAERSALVTVTQYSTSGSTETAEQSADIVLANQGDSLYVFTRDPDDAELLVPQGLDDDEVIELVRTLATPEAKGGEMPSSAEQPSKRLAKIRTTIMRRLRRGPADESTSQRAKTP